jgi:hypothetical protein
MTTFTAPQDPVLVLSGFRLSFLGLGGEHLGLEETWMRKKFPNKTRGFHLQLYQQLQGVLISSSWPRTVSFLGLHISFLLSFFICPPSTMFFCLLNCFFPPFHFVFFRLSPFPLFIVRFLLVSLPILFCLGFCIYFFRL